MDRNIDCRFLDELAFNDPLNFRAMCLQLGNENKATLWPRNIFVSTFGIGFIMIYPVLGASMWRADLQGWIDDEALKDDQLS